MRKVGAGLGGLALAAGLASTFALSAGAAAPPDGTSVQRATVDELPNPAEEKRRALREVALQKVIAGDAKVRRRGASKVVKVARANGEDQYVELAREKTDKIFVILAEFGDTRHASYPDRDTNPNIPGPATFNGPLHNAIPAPDRSKDNSTVWQPNYDRAHYQDVYFGNGESLKTYYERQSSGRYSVEGLVTDWVKVQLQRGALRPQRRLPVRHQRVQQHVVPDPGRDQHVGRRPEGRGRHRHPDRRGARDLRHLGPQRLRQRRQLQRARRLHRPLPDRPLRRRPGRRRPAPGRGRDLVAPLEGVPEPDRDRRPGLQQGRRHPDRHHRPVGRRLHDPAGERRRLGVRARVRPRPRPARPLRHLGRRRERRQLVDDHGPEPRLGARGPGHRHPPGRPRRVGQAPARLARLRDRAGGSDPHARPRPARVQQRQGAGRGRAAAAEDGDLRPRGAGGRDQAVVVRDR